MAIAQAPIAARPAPPVPQGWRGAWVWARRELFGSALSSAFTLLALGLLIWLGWGLLQWGLLNAVFGADLAACQAARGQGACWGVLAEKGRLVLFGRYPLAEQWRAEAATAL
ncbi:MAG TPA: amino acid ABC transporter permease, partial [Burkholderiaceae bacterium]|nr:amino acid ABC transporter permease [Burkholderiaceae bacterium]